MVKNLFKPIIKYFKKKALESKRKDRFHYECVIILNNKQDEIKELMKQVNQAYEIVALGTENYNNLQGLDNYMMANGLECVDEEGIGYTAYFRNPSTGETTDDPFEDGWIERGIDLPEDTYDNYEESWDGFKELTYLTKELKKAAEESEHMFKRFNDLNLFLK
jgi:hypothetical protein